MWNNSPRPNSMKRKNMEYSKCFKIENDSNKMLNESQNNMIVIGIKSILNQRLKLRNDVTSFAVFAIAIPLAISIFIIDTTDLKITPIITIIAGLVSILIFGLIRYHLYNNCFITIEFALDKKSNNKYNKTKTAISHLAASQYVWFIKEVSRVLYARVNSGATWSVDRERIFFELLELPSYIKSININKFYSFALNTQERYYFLPNGILYINKMNIAIINYSDIEVIIEESHFRESEKSPNDSVVLGYTWNYVNIDGTPDMRFKENYKIPILLYSNIYIKSRTGLNICLLVSNRQSAMKFKELLLGKKSK